MVIVGSHNEHNASFGFQEVLRFEDKPLLAAHIKVKAQVIIIITLWLLIIGPRLNTLKIFLLAWIVVGMFLKTNLPDNY